MTLSTPVKVFALGALAAMLGLGGFVFFFAAKSPAPEPIVVTHHAVAHRAPVVQHVVAKAHKPHVDESVPAPLRGALAHHAVVVAVVFSSNVAVDRAALVEARAGAQAAHAGFVALDVHREAVAEQVASFAGVDDPAVYVLHRGDKLVGVASGTFDRETVAAAVAAVR